MHRNVLGDRASLSNTATAALLIAAALQIATEALAAAERPPGDPGNASTEPRIEEILVTAQKRQENLQQVPISAQVIGGQTLSDQNLNSLIDLAKTTPSVLVDDGGRSQTLRIRGIGSGPNQSFDQSVALFVDDVYHGRSRTSVASFLDLNRVEILKGPQTIFFGNNAIAGAFNIVTKKPSDRLDGFVRALYGEGSQYAVEAAAGGPLTGNLAARAAVQFNGPGGWVTNVNTGKNSREDDMTGRLTLLFKPTDDLNVTMKVEGSRNKSGGYPLTIVHCPPPPPFPVSAYCTSAIARGLPIGLASGKDSEGPGQSMHYRAFENALSVNYERWSHTFTSVSGYYDYDYNLNLDVSGVPEFIVHAQLPEKYHQFSQELRVASAGNQPVEYLVGTYFQTDGLLGGSSLGYGLLTPAFSATPLAPYLPVGQAINVNQRERSHAAFGALTWNVTSHLKLTGGVRASWVKKDFDWSLFYGTTSATYGAIVPLPATLASFRPLRGLGTPGTIRLNRQDSAVSPSAKIQYQFTPASMVYASYSDGFKAGGFNFAQNTADPTQYPYGPEHVKAYELGLKNEFFDRLILNLAVFRNDFTDLQVSSNFNINGAYFSLVKNAASARSQGIELETQWVVAEGFRLAAGVTYLDAKYLRYPNAAPSLLQTFCSAHPTNATCLARFPNGITIGPLGVDASGTRTDYAPTWSGNLTVTYTKTIPSDYRLTVELNTSAVSDYRYNILDQRADGYVRLDTRLTLETPGSRWFFDLIGKNLSNAIVPGYGGFPSGAGQTGIEMNTLQPRNFAFQVRCHW